jgi:DnaD/phage-associated family protein
MAFDGFTTEKLVGLPPELFSEILPQISLPSELKVTLHLFWRLSRQRGPAPRRLSWDDLEGDRTLRRSLRSISKLRSPQDLLAEGLAAAVQRRTLLHIVLPADGRAVNWYLVNTATNRAWVTLAGDAGVAEAPGGGHPNERPSIMALYEQNIGLITPMLLEELRDAEERYPPHWIEDAIREAVHANARSWRYIRKVLERWAANGRQDATDRSERPIDVDRYTDGAYGDLFRRGSDTADL